LRVAVGPNNTAAVVVVAVVVVVEGRTVLGRILGQLPCYCC
jgi:hypothetical protein